MTKELMSWKFDQGELEVFEINTFFLSFRRNLNKALKIVFKKVCLDSSGMTNRMYVICFYKL